MQNLLTVEAVKENRNTQYGGQLRDVVQEYFAYVHSMF